MSYYLKIIFITSISIIIHKTLSVDLSNCREYSSTKKYKCYKYLKVVFSADTTCRRAGSKIARITSSEDLDNANNFLPSYSEVFVDGEAVEGKWDPVFFMYYKDNLYSGNCAVIKFTSHHTVDSIIASRCNSSLNFICQFPISNRYCRNFSKTKTYCYHFHYLKRNFYEATSLCQQRGGFLATFEGNVKNLRTANFIRSGSFWTGITRKPWEFQDGTRINQFFWAQGEPSNDKLIIKKGAYNVEWYTVSKSRQTTVPYVLCEYVHTPEIPKGSKTDDALNVTTIAKAVVGGGIGLLVIVSVCIIYLCRCKYRKAHASRPNLRIIQTHTNNTQMARSNQTLNVSVLPVSEPNFPAEPTCPTYEEISRDVPPKYSDLFPNGNK